jgi:hypothetical protein
MAVTTSLIGGTLSIAGSAANDDIAIVGTDNPGEITVIGRNGTTVNGVVNGSSTIPGVTADLAIDLAAGDDRVSIDNVFLAGHLILETGDGDDTIVLGESGVVSPEGNLEINSGSGDDNVSALGYHVFVAGGLFLETGEGNDSVTMTGASALEDLQVGDDTEGADADNSFTCLLNGVTCAGNLGVYGDAGTNSVAVLNTAATLYLNVDLEGAENTIYVDTCYSAGYISLLGGEYEAAGAARDPAASSTINVFRCALLGLQVYGSAGDDTINVSGNLVTAQQPFAGQPETFIVLYIDSGVGNDTVTGQYNVVTSVLSVQLSDGNDSLSLAGNLVTATAALDGGAGGDALSLSANAFGSLFTSNF